MAYVALLTSPLLLFIFVIDGLLGFVIFLGVLVVVVDWLSRIAGIVLLIYVRVKYSMNRFGKILMWIYIGIAMILLILFIIYPDYFVSLFQELEALGRKVWTVFGG